MKYVKPNLFIVGAAKAGTYTMHKVLNQHPEIYMSEIKETDFFSSFPSYDKIRKKDIKEYIHCFFKHVKDEAYIGESSVSYLPYKNCAAIIHAFNPDAKILIILRNPIRRAISYYKMLLRDKRASEPFDKIIKSREKIKTRGLYYQDVKRYFDIFGRNNVKVIIFEDMIQNMDAVYKDICTFLDVSPYDFDFTKKYNMKGKIDNSLYSKIYFSYYKLVEKPKVKRLLRIFISKQKLWKFNKKLRYRLLEKHIVPDEDPIKIPISQDSIDRLKEFYHKDIEQLEQLLNIDLTMWR